MFLCVCVGLEGMTRESCRKKNHGFFNIFSTFFLLSIVDLQCCVNFCCNG